LGDPSPDGKRCSIRAEFIRNSARNEDSLVKWLEDINDVNQNKIV
jgi:hypothetical protein